jgi:Ala-tRNA(Pro) deacylase
MPATPDDLFARLADLGIATVTHRHPPLFTVEESKALRGELPGGHCKSLFLKAKDGSLWLAVAPEDAPVDLKRLAKDLGVGTLSFGRPELLYEVLGVTPGSVTPFALVNDRDRRVGVLLDAAMLREDPLNYHPLTNEATTAIAAADLLRFIAACGHEPRILELPRRPQAA